MVSRTRYFIGIDLAWSPRNKTGIAISATNGSSPRRATVLAYDLVRTDEEILAFIAAHVPRSAPCLVAIDAPITVPNTTGRRPCEAELTADFRAYHAGTHPSNRTRLGAWNGGTPRGEALVARLGAIGVAHDPALDSRMARRCFEVYPHPAMIVLFNLTKVLPYKSRPSRTDAMRWKAFVTYARLLRGLDGSDPSLTAPRSLFSARPLTGVALKAYEDRLDAVFCSYLAQYVARFPKRCRIYGVLASGYIVTPVRHTCVLTRPCLYS